MVRYSVGPTYAPGPGPLSDHSQHTRKLCHSTQPTSLQSSPLQPSLSRGSVPFRTKVISLNLQSYSCWLGLTRQSFTVLAKMIDSVGRIVFPSSLFGRSDPVIYNGPGPCLIHTSPAERGSTLKADFTGDSHYTHTHTQASDVLSGRNSEPRFMTGTAGCTSDMRDAPSPVLSPLPTYTFQILRTDHHTVKKTKTNF